MKCRKPKRVVLDGSSLDRLEVSLTEDLKYLYLKNHQVL